jgi:hypothetical protein
VIVGLAAWNASATALAGFTVDSALSTSSLIVVEPPAAEAEPEPEELALELEPHPARASAATAAVTDVANSGHRSSSIRLSSAGGDHRDV